MKDAVLSLTSAGNHCAEGRHRTQAPGLRARRLAQGPGARGGATSEHRSQLPPFALVWGWAEREVESSGAGLQGVEEELICAGN